MVQGSAGAATMEAVADELKLCRDQGFVAFVLTAAQRQLAACEASDLTAAIATGTGGWMDDTVGQWKGRRGRKARRGRVC